MFLRVFFLLIWMHASEAADPEIDKLQQNIHALTEEKKTTQKKRVVLERALNTSAKIAASKTADLQKDLERSKKLLSSLTKLGNAKNNFSFSLDKWIRAMILIRALSHEAIHREKQLLHDQKKAAKHHERIRLMLSKETKKEAWLYKQALEATHLLKKRQHFIEEELKRRKALEEYNRKVRERAQHKESLLKMMRTKKGHYGSKMLSMLPVKGQIQSAFGTIDTLNPDGKGIVVNVSTPQRVSSPLEGQVVFLGPFRSYKNIIILKHQKDMYLLLAGISRLDVDLGQSIQPGQALGVLEKNKYLYIELRQGEKFIDPLSFFLRKKQSSK